MKRRGRPPRNRATEEARQENGDIDKIPPMAGEVEDIAENQTLVEAAELVPGSMLEEIRLEMGGVLPNAWGLTNPKVIVAAVVRVYERGWV